MKAFGSLFYIVTTFIFIGLGTSSIQWGAFNMVTILLSVCIFSYESTKMERVNKFTRMLSSYVITLSVMRIIYTLCCVYSLPDWVYSTNIIFLLLALLVFIAYVLFYIVPILLRK